MLLLGHPPPQSCPFRSWGVQLRLTFMKQPVLVGWPPTRSSSTNCSCHEDSHDPGSEGTAYLGGITFPHFLLLLGQALLFLVKRLGLQNHFFELKGGVAVQPAFLQGSQVDSLLRYLYLSKTRPNRIRRITLPPAGAVQE